MLVDAPSRDRYASSHLPHEFVDEGVLPDRGAGILVYCMNEECEASALEARELARMGYENVRHYKGGNRRGSAPSSPSRAGCEVS